jgi:hypothetical protein
VTTDIDKRIDTFWQWVRYNATALRSAALQADIETLNALVSAIYEKIADVSEELVVDLHVDPRELTLAVRTGRPDRSLVDRILARAPQIPLWKFAPSIPPDLDSILTRTTDGRTFSLKYSALSFELLFDQPDDGARIVLVLQDDFDPDGQDAHVFQDVATHVLTTFLGRVPERVAGYRLIPARLAHKHRTRPIFELADAWLAATAGQ